MILILIISGIVLWAFIATAFIMLIIEIMNGNLEEYNERHTF